MSAPCAACTHAPAAPSLAARLRSLYEAARAAWPTVEVPYAGFVDHLAQALGQATASDSLAALLEQRQTSELYLAVGCLSGLPAAIRAFEQQYFGQIDTLLRRLRARGVEADELKQRARENLFLVRANGAPALLAQYRGQAPLAVWFRVVATRMILNAATRAPRDRPAAAEDAALFDRMDLGDGPDRAYLRRLYDGALRQALPYAFATLSAKQRLLLRQRYLDDLPVEDIAALQGVHRATIKRHLADARARLTRSLYDRLTADLDVPVAELGSILRVVQSGFHITVRRLLADPG